MNLADYIRDVDDFPIEGIVFKDITPLLQAPSAFQSAVDQMLEQAAPVDYDIIAAPDARGFIFGVRPWSLGSWGLGARARPYLCRNEIVRLGQLCGCKESTMHLSSNQQPVATTRPGQCGRTLRRLQCIASSTAQAHHAWSCDLRA